MRGIKVCPQVVQKNQKPFVEDYLEARIMRLEEDVEYLKASINNNFNRRFKDDIEDLFTRTLNFEDIENILMSIEERVKEVEDNISFKETLDIMRKERVHLQFEEKTRGEGFINLHLRDEVKPIEVLRKDIERTRKEKYEQGE